MNYDNFKAILAKSNRRILLVGFLFLLIGAPILVSNFIGNSQMAAWIISLLFILLVLLVIIRSMNDLSKIKSDSLPLLKAIKQKQLDYVVWIYQKEITSKVEGVKVSKSNNIIVRSNDNKHFEIVLTKKTSPTEIITYLTTLFPKVYVGYSDEIKREVELQLKNKTNR